MTMAIVDFFGVTFRLDDRTEARELAEMLIKLWMGPEARIVETGRGWSGYKCRLDIAGAGLIAFGGNDDTLHIELTGSGCIQVKDWDEVAESIEVLHGKLTRVDVAGDDLTGESYDLAWARREYDDGGFKPARGAHPKAHLYDDLGSGDGCTLYVGSRESGKLFRGYEKGKQLGDKASPWFRVEVEYRSVHRELPVQMLTDPSAYLAGSYPCLNDWNVEQRQVLTVAYTAMAKLDKAIEHAKKQAGRVIHALQVLNGGSIADTLAQLHVPELPRRLRGEIMAFLALDESERTYTSAKAPAWAAKGTPDEHGWLQRAMTLPRAVWRTGQGSNGHKPGSGQGAPLPA